MTSHEPYAGPPMLEDLPGEIWVLRHDHNHGEDISLHSTHESALADLA